MQRSTRKQVHERCERTGFVRCRAQCLPHPEELPPTAIPRTSSSVNRQDISSEFPICIIATRGAYSFVLSGIVTMHFSVFMKMQEPVFSFLFFNALCRNHTRNLHRPPSAVLF
jgi:hypothetical protein